MKEFATDHAMTSEDIGSFLTFTALRPTFR
jgi:hypothetical protein